MTPVFRLEQVTKRYKHQLALDKVSLEAESGKVFALLGENGAGKTTSLRILLGLTQPDSGTAHVLGLDSQQQGQEIRRRVGYVPEQPTLYEWMTVAEIGWFTSGFYPPGFLEKYRQLVQGFGLPEDRKLKHLSKGMRAKVALLLAMAHEPELLVLDEPTSGLDSMVRREFLESMVDVAATGRTVLLSSHQIDEVERVADVVAILKHGKLVLCEPLDELKKDVCELTIALKNGSPAAPEVPGAVIQRKLKDRTWRMLVRGINEQQTDAVRSYPEVGNVEVRHPSLEEIFVGYMQEAEAGEPNAESQSR